MMSADEVFENVHILMSFRIFKQIQTYFQVYCALATILLLHLLPKDELVIDTGKASVHFYATVLGMHCNWCDNMRMGYKAHNDRVRRLTLRLAICWWHFVLGFGSV